jgi:Flp pilus assembly protein TadD
MSDKPKCLLSKATILFLVGILHGQNSISAEPLPRSATRNAQPANPWGNTEPFDKLELFCLFAAGPIPLYAKSVLQERGVDFTPDAEFISAFPVGAQQEILRRVRATAPNKRSAARDQAYQLASKAYQEQRSHQYPAASSEYQKALQLAPDSATLHLAYAAQLLFAKDFAHSDEEARISMKLWPEYAEAHGMHALSMVLQKRSADAETEAKETLRIFGGHSSAKFLLAQALTNEHKYKEAIPAIRMAMAATPSMTALTKFLGIALLETGDSANGAAYLAVYVKMDPTDVEGFYYYGKSLKVKGEKEKAHAQFAQAARLQPNNPVYKSAAEN